MDPKVKIRKATPADAPAVASLLDQLGYQETEGFLGVRMAELAGDPNEQLVLAERSGEIVAVLSLHLIPQLAVQGAFARISYLCVQQGCRGKGIGRELEAYAEAVARASGCDRIELHCHGRRVAAHRFYARQGYEESPKYFVKRLRPDR